jgi:hypothetical protein
MHEARLQGRASLYEPLRGVRYFFTHALAVASHFMSFAFSQSAFVAGTAGSAANAGAVNASKRAATIALLRILTDIEVSSFELGHLMTPGCIFRPSMHVEIAAEIGFQLVDREALVINDALD